MIRVIVSEFLLYESVFIPLFYDTTGFYASMMGSKRKHLSLSDKIKILQCQDEEKLSG